MRQERDIQKTCDGVELLQQELTRRISANPRYSLRAFAKSLAVSPATLSLVLSRKLRLSKKNVEKISKVIPLSPDQLSDLRRNAGFKENMEASELTNVTMEIFTVLSEWYHFAILSLLELPHSSLDPRWVAKKLGITLTEAKLAIDRLLRLNLIGKVNGRYKQITAPMRIGNLLSNAAARKFQRQLVEKALSALENDPPGTRDITSMTFAMDPRELNHASKKITSFRRKLTKELESRGKPDSVYTLTVQLFKMSKE